MRQVSFSSTAQMPNVSTDRFPELFESSFKALFKALADPSEKCREESIRLVTSFFQAVPDLTPYMAYFFPVGGWSGRTEGQVESGAGGWVMSMAWWCVVCGRR